MYELLPLQPGHIMRDKNFELETKLVLLNFYEHTCRGRSYSCDITAQYGVVPSDNASRKYRSLPESSRERSPANQNYSQPDTPAARLSRSELRPEILNMHLSQNSSELSSGSFDGSNLDADDEMESNPSVGSTFSQHSMTFPRRNRLSTVYSESELSPDIQSGRVPPPNSFPQLLFRDSIDESSDLQVDALGEDNSSNCTSPDDDDNDDDAVDTFRNQVRHMRENLESESEELKSLANTPDSEGQSRPLSPISDAARKLGKISDEIQLTYGPRIEQSICRLHFEHLNYDEFCNTLNCLLGPAETNWIMISAVMLFSKRCARYFYNQGVNCMSRILDFTTDYLEDVAADFIINSGGWTNVSQFSEEQLLEGGLENYDFPDSDNNPSNHWQPRGSLPIPPDNTQLSTDETHPHISTPLEYLNPEPSEAITSPNALDPTTVVALAAMICASYIYLTK